MSRRLLGGATKRRTGELERAVGRAVGAAVVDDEHLDAIDAVDVAQLVGERGGELVALVEAGDLGDELHCANGG